MQEFLVLASLHFFSLVVPGSDFSVTVRNSVIGGKSVGVFTALGIGAGISVHVAYTVAGFGALTHTIPELLVVVEVIGACYLLFLAYKTFFDTNATDVIIADDGLLQGSPESRKFLDESLVTAFKEGFLTNALNPKVTLFFLAIFTTVVSPETPMQVQFFYGVWTAVVSAGWFVIVAFFFARENVRVLFLKKKRVFEIVISVLLTLFALTLIVPLLMGFLGL